jgi:hypothetical protein
MHELGRRYLDDTPRLCGVVRQSQAARSSEDAARRGHWSVLLTAEVT